MRRATILVAALAAILAAAASAAGPWREHRTPELTVRLPAGWADATSERKRIFSEAARVTKDDPYLAAMLRTLAESGDANRAIRLIAFDLAPSSLASGFATNLNVIREPTVLPLAAWREQSLKGLASTSFVRQPVWWRTVKLPAGKAVRFSYRARFTAGTRKIEASIVQYGLVAHGAAHILTYTTTASQAARYRAIFDSSARTVRFR